MNNDDLDEIGRKIAQYEGRKVELEEQKAALSDKLDTAVNERASLYTAAQIGQWITDRVRSKVRNIFTNVGTKALQAIFGPDTKFLMQTDITDAGNRRCRLLIERDGVIQDPVRASGNSVGAVLSTLLRRLVILLHPDLSNVIIADEPLYGIDRGRADQMAMVDREMCDEHDMQFIGIMHETDEAYQRLCDTWVTVEQEKHNTSTVTIEESV